MWYAFRMDEGLIYTESKKSDILNKGYKTRERLSKGAYELEGIYNDGLNKDIIWIYNGKERAIKDGWKFE